MPGCTVLIISLVLGLNFREILTEDYINVNSGLTALPLNIPHTVDRIYLNRNLLSVLPTFPAFPQLAVLFLSQNNLKQFPDLQNVGTTLTELNLSKNQINTINCQYLDALTQLSILNLGYNGLTAFEDVSGPANTLTVLRLENNRLTKIPPLENIGKNLKVLNLNHNNFATAREADFRWFQNVEALDIVGASLPVFPSMTSMGDTLETLVLSSNNFHTVPEMELRKMKKLQSMTLNWNDLQTIPNLCFLPSAEFISGLFIMVPLVCDCRMRWFKWHTAHVHIRSTNFLAYCTYPAAMNAQVAKMEDLKCTGGWVADEYLNVLHCKLQHITVHEALENNTYNMQVRPVVE